MLLDDGNRIIIPQGNFKISRDALTSHMTGRDYSKIDLICASVRLSIRTFRAELFDLGCKLWFWVYLVTSQPSSMVGVTMSKEKENDL